MKTNPRHLDLLSDFFKDSEDGWAHVITIMEYGIKDVQLYRFDSPPTLFGIGGRKTLVLTFIGCERYKIVLRRENNLVYRIDVYPSIYHYREITSLFRPNFDQNLVCMVKSIGDLVDMARAGKLH